MDLHSTLLAGQRALVTGGPVVVALLFFRSVPFVIYSCVTRRVPLARRCILAIAFALLTLFAIRTNAALAPILGALPLVAAWLVAGAAVVHRASALLPARAVRGGAVLLLAAFLFLLLPASLVHHPVMAPALVVGWEAMLSAHSYAVDTRAASSRPALSACLFFLFVDPTFLYAESAARREALQAKTVAGGAGALRIVRGALTMLGRDLALVAVGTLAFTGAADRDAAAVDTYARFCLSQLLLAIGLYCAHSGLASIQIGWMRVLGLEVPERYARPLFARDPQDFWRRWNVWVSQWAARYIHLPLAHRFSRRARRGGALLAAMVTFLVLGLLHDIGLHAFRLEEQRATGVSLRFTLVFFAFGLSFVSWVAIHRRIMRRTAAPARREPRPLRIVSRLAWVNLGLGLVWLVVPLLRTGALPAPLERVVGPWVQLR